MGAERVRVVAQAVAEPVGLVLIPAGVWFIYWPASLIVAGALLLAASFAVQRNDAVPPGGERE
jgi:hypothetical protein